MSVNNSDSEYYYYSDEEREVLPEKRNSAQIKFDRLYRYQRRQREQEEQRQKEKEQHQKEEQEVEKNLRDFVHKFNSRKETSEGTTGTETTTGNPEHRRTSAGAGIARFRNRDVQEISRETYRKELLAKRIAGHTTPYHQIQASATGNITSNRSEQKQEEQKLQEQKQQEQKQQEQKQEEQKQEEAASEIMESDIIESDHLSENEEEEASKKEPEPAPVAPAPAAPAPKEPAPEEEDIPMPPPAPEEAIVREEFVQQGLEIMKQIVEKESRRISRAIEKPGEKQRAVAEETLRKRAHEETLKLNERITPEEPEIAPPSMPESIVETAPPAPEEAPAAAPEPRPVPVPDPDRDRVYTFPPHLDNNAEYIGAIHQHLDYSEDDIYLPRWLSDEQKELLKKYQGTLLHFAIDHLLDEKAELTAIDPELVRQRYRNWLYHYRYPVRFVHDYFSVILLLQDGWCPQVRTLEENLGTFTRLCLYDLKPLLEIVREEFLQYCCDSYDLQRQFRRLIMKHLALLNIESHVDDYQFLAKEQHAFQKCYMPLRWDISYSGGKHATLLYSYQAELLYRAGVIELPHIVRSLKFRARDFRLNNRDESVRVESADEYSSEETPNEDDYFYYPDMNPVDPLDEL